MNVHEIILSIKNRRKVLRLTQEHLAELAGTGVATLKRFESGRGNLGLENLIKIIDVLGLEINRDKRTLQFLQVKPKRTRGATINMIFHMKALRN